MRNEWMSGDSTALDVNAAFLLDIDGFEKYLREDVKSPYTGYWHDWHIACF